MWKLALALPLTLLACGGRQTAGKVEPVAEVAAPTKAATEEAVGVLERYRQAYELHSVDALALVYETSLDLDVVVEGKVHLGWDQVQEFLGHRLANVSKVRATTRDVRTTVIGEHVVVRCDFELSLGDEETSVSERGQLTLVLRSGEAGLKIVHEHFSIPARN